MGNNMKRGVTLLAAIVILCGSGGFPVQSRAENPAVKALPVTSRKLFLEKCGRCHEPERAYGIIEDWTTWVLTVARMAIKKRQWLPPEAVKQVIGYHNHYRSHQGSLFQEHCGECHTREELQGIKKTAAQVRTWINYMAQRHNGQNLTKEECELILCGLTG